jgi:hypothetical protein
MKIKDFLKNVPSELLSEETLTSIETAFNDRVNIHVEKALTQQDELYAEKLQTLIQAIDTDHVRKLNKVVEAIDKNNTIKLKSVIKKYEKDLNGSAATFKEGIIDSISDYLDVYIEELIPTADIKQAVKNKQALTVLEGLRKTLAVDSALMKDSIRDAVLEGKTSIDKAQTTVSTLTTENAKLKNELSKFKIKNLLEEKTADMPADKKNYLVRMLGDKTLQFINENFDYTSKLFDKKDKERVSVLKEEALSNRVVKQDAPKEVVSENKKVDNSANIYVNELARIK